MPGPRQRFECNYLTMNEFQKEINELKEFIVELKADRAAAKQKEKSEAWTKYVSLTIVVIAVIAAVAAQYSGKYGSRVQLNQAQASDQWNYYESKSIKQHLDENAKSELEHVGNAADPKVQMQIQRLSTNLVRYSSQMISASNTAKAFELKRDDASQRGGQMGMASSLLSVAIATASICTVTKKKPLWFIAMLMAAFALAKMIVAWTM